MLIKPVSKSNNQINFKSHDFKTMQTNEVGDVKVYNHYTYIGRDLEDNFLLKDLLQSNFPEGATIINHGCSTGAESYTLAMSLGNSSKYPIKAYDISPNAIGIAKQGLFPIARNKIENNVINDDYYLNAKNSPESIKNPLKKIFRNLFDKHFQQTNSLNPSSEKITAALSYDNYQASEELKCNISFDVQDIENMKELKLNELEPKPGVFTFKNCWSYLFNNERGQVRINNNVDQIFSKVSKVIEEISHILPSNGLLSVGDCPYDYFVRNQENKMITPPPLVEILSKKGFEPVKESIKKISLDGFVDYIPTIWKKL